MKQLRTFFFTGLLIVAPIALAYYILKELFFFVDGLFREPIQNYFSVYLEIDKNMYGIGVLAVVFLLIIIGWITKYYVGVKLLQLTNYIFDKIPLFNRILKMIRQISEAFFSGQKDVFQKAVLIEYPRKGMYSIAFFTGDTKGEVKEKAGEELVSVFLPTTPNPTSGFLLFIPKDEIKPLDMTIENALKLIISGGAFNPEDMPEIEENGKGK